MKKLSVLLTIVTLTMHGPAHAEGWLDSIKGLFGMQEKSVAAPNIGDMVGSVSKSLGVSNSQATAGLGSLFNYAKNNISSEQLSKLSSTLPGLEGLIAAAPDVSELASEGTFGSLLDKAASYNESLNAINNVKKQFEALGLKPEMISQFIQKTGEYLDTEEGKQAKQILMDGLGKLLV